MSKKSVIHIPIFDDRVRSIVDHLKTERFSNKEIAVGVGAGGIATGLVGLGIPQIEAERWEGRVRTGNRQISVRTEDLEGIARGMGMFKEVRVQDIRNTDEAFGPNENLAADRDPGPFEFSAA